MNSETEAEKSVQFFPEIFFLNPRLLVYLSIDGEKSIFHFETTAIMQLQCRNDHNAIYKIKEKYFTAKLIHELN